MDQFQSQYMTKYLRISSSYRKPCLLYDFSTAPFWISLYNIMYEEIFIFFFISVLFLWGSLRRRFLKSWLDDCLGRSQLPDTICYFLLCLSPEGRGRGEGEGRGWGGEGEGGGRGGRETKRTLHGPDSLSNYKHVGNQWYILEKYGSKKRKKRTKAIQIIYCCLSRLWLWFLQKYPLYYNIFRVVSHLPKLGICTASENPIWFRFMCSQKWNCAAFLFPEQNYNVLSPNFHIHVSMSYLYTPRISLPILLQTYPGNI